MADSFDVIVIGAGPAGEAAVNGLLRGTAAEPQARRFNEIDHAGLGDRMRDPNSRLGPSGGPEREVAARRVADRDDDAQLLDKSNQVVDAGGHVLERLRPAAPSAKPPVLQVPGRPAGACEVLAESVHQRAVVGVPPEAAVDDHRHGSTLRAGGEEQLAELARMVAIAVDSAGDTLI